MRLKMAAGCLRASKNVMFIVVPRVGNEQEEWKIKLIELVLLNMLNLYELKR